MNLQDLSLHFSSLRLEGYQFECQIIPSEVDVLQVVIEGFEELPVYISATDTQVLCITYLFSEDEVKADAKNEMHELMLDMNIPMPLSSFSKIQHQYVIFGALSANSGHEDVAHEAITLTENAVEVLSMMSDFLK